MYRLIEKYINICGNMLLPCFLFALSLIAYLLSGGFDYGRALLYHRLFIGGSILIGMVLLYFNRGRLLFLTLSLFVAYIGLNFLKRGYIDETTAQIYYANLAVMLPLNCLFFYFYAPRRLLSLSALLCLLGLALEYILLEFLAAEHLALAYYQDGINLPALSAFAAALLCPLWRAARTGDFYDYGSLFIIAAAGCGVYFYTSASALSLFFFVAALISLLVIIRQLLQSYLYDSETFVYNRLSYLRHSKRFPPKYSLGVIAVDGFDGLNRALSGRQRQELLLLLIEIMQENIGEDASIYRYDTNNFVLVCEKTGLKEIYETFEAIRRSVAAAEFVLSGRRTQLKVTISGGIAEKRRVDTGAAAVLMRANAEMQKTLAFTGNVISPAPKSSRK